MKTTLLVTIILSILVISIVVIILPKQLWLPAIIVSPFPPIP